MSAVEETAVGGPAGLDPVTFEVIRHRLWAINDDQGRMAARLSGSYVIYESYDFNAALITADGRGLFCGIYILQHGATIDEFVRLVLDTWPADDIRPGDMFFSNDPWWGALHANDGILAMPIFWEGEIVAWSGIVLHDDDVGSPVPGSFVSGSKDRFGEAPLFPAIKMAENFQAKVDVERAYLRNSRVPASNSLNMRARVGALEATYHRIEDLIREYGIDAFLAAQEGIISHVERILRSRLREIPDGEWYARTYHDHDGNENELYPLCCRIVKRGDKLVFDLTGTAEQAIGSINCARPAMEGSVTGVVLTFLCYDLPWAIGAVRNIIEIVSEPGTVNNATSPAGVSMASIMGTLSTFDVVAHAFAKMMLSSEKYRAEAQANWTPGVSGGLLVAPNPEGEPWVGAITDFVTGGGGARTFADGVDSGGIFHSMATQGPNAETVESRIPVLQLYRREVADTGGPGRFRGGVATEFATVPHKLPASPAGLNSLGSGVSVPAGRGLSGAGPGAVAGQLVLRGTNLSELFARGTLPASIDEIDRERLELLEAKSFTQVEEGDLVIGVLPGGGGYGDPLSREPAAVLADVRQGLVTPEAAESVYGVVVSDGELDEQATARARERVRDERRSESRPVSDAVGDARLEGGEVAHPVSDSVEAVDVDGRRELRCSVCHHRYGPYEQDHKQAALVRDLPLTALSPRNGRAFDHVVARQFYCPGCLTAIAIDIQKRDEPFVDESRFAT